MTAVVVAAVVARGSHRQHVYYIGLRRQLERFGRGPRRHLNRLRSEGAGRFVWWLARDAQRKVKEVVRLRLLLLLLPYLLAHLRDGLSPALRLARTATAAGAATSPPPSAAAWSPTIARIALAR